MIGRMHREILVDINGFRKIDLNLLRYQSYRDR